MRVGINPNRRKIATQQPDELALVVVHLPHTRGYHADRLEIVQASLLTLRAGAPGLFVHVWDNGSSAQMRDWLLDVYQPDALTLAPNLGKPYAMAAVFNGYPEDTIISYADDDMLYQPGWYVAQRELLDVFDGERVLVTGYPTRAAFRWGNRETLRKLAALGATVERGDWLPAEWLDDYQLSVGADVLPDSIQHVHEYRAHYRGVSFYVTGHHCQFVARAGDVREYMEFHPQLTRNERLFDERVDAAGVLRVATMQRYTQHMGNRLDAKLRDAVSELLQ